MKLSNQTKYFLLVTLIPIFSILILLIDRFPMYPLDYTSANMLIDSNEKLGDNTTRKILVSVDNRNRKMILLNNSNHDFYPVYISLVSKDLKDKCIIFNNEKMIPSHGHITVNYDCEINNKYLLIVDENEDHYYYYRKRSIFSKTD